MIAGRTTRGSTPYPMPVGTKRVSRLNVGQQGNVAKATLWLDGGGGDADQVARALIYDAATEVLLAVSSEVTISPGTAAAWVDFRFDGHTTLPLGDVLVGIFAGPYADTIRVYGDDPHGAGGKTNADDYTDGPSNPFGAATALTADLSVFLTLFVSSADLPRPNESDLYFSRLPLPEAQAVFAESGPAGPEQVATIGWHDTFTDPEMGANALVRETGPFEGLLGERVRVTIATDPAHPRSLVVYVHDLADADAIDWDVSLPRAAFGQLDLLSTETVQGIVQVVA